MVCCHDQHKVDITRSYFGSDKTPVHYYRLHESALFQLTDELRESRPQPWSTIVALKDTETLYRFIHRVVVDAFRQTFVVVKLGNHSPSSLVLLQCLDWFRESEAYPDPLSF